MRRLHPVFSICFICCLLASSAVLADDKPKPAETKEPAKEPEKKVLFPDANLEKAVRKELKKKDGEELKDEDLKNLYFLESRKSGIENLAGLEKCVNLSLVNLTGNKVADIKPLAGLVKIQSLDLSSNAIIDISPLAKLVKLQYVQLEKNKIIDVSPLSGLPKLTSLYLSENQIADLKPLAKLEKLRSLYLKSNKIKEIKPLAKLTKLSSLDLSMNEVGDVSALSEMTELRFTFLNKNKVTDLAPLVEMAKKDVAGKKRFAPYWNLYVGDNPLSDDATGKQIPELKKLGVRVRLKLK